MLLISLSVLGAGGYTVSKMAAECRVPRESKRGVGWQLTQPGGVSGKGSWARGDPKNEQELTKRRKSLVGRGKNGAVGEVVRLDTERKWRGGAGQSRPVSLPATVAFLCFPRGLHTKEQTPPNVSQRL